MKYEKRNQNSNRVKKNWIQAKIKNIIIIQSKKKNYETIM